MNWKIDGVPAESIIRMGLDQNGGYKVSFNKSEATLEQIEGINWAQPKVLRIHADADVLPYGYGFDMVKITYSSLPHQYAVELKVKSQYLGDVTGYQAVIEEKEMEIAQKEAEIGGLRTDLQEKEAAVGELTGDLEQAYELLYGGDEA